MIIVFNYKSNIETFIQKFNHLIYVNTSMLLIIFFNTFK